MFLCDVGYMHSAPLGWRDFVRPKNFNSLMVTRGKRQKQIELSLWKQWFAIPISDRISIPAWISARCPPYPSSFGNLHAVLAPQLRYTEVMSSVKNEKTWNNLPVTQSSFFITFLSNRIQWLFFRSTYMHFHHVSLYYNKIRWISRYSQLPAH